MNHERFSHMGRIGDELGKDLFDESVADCWPRFCRDRQRFDLFLLEERQYDLIELGGFAFHVLEHVLPLHLFLWVFLELLDELQTLFVKRVFGDVHRCQVKLPASLMQSELTGPANGVE